MSEPVSKIFNGTYTVTSPKGGHRTFSIRTAKNGKLKGSRILSMLTGPNNTRDYTGFGFVNENGVAIWGKRKDNPDWEKYAKLLWSLATEGEVSPYYLMGYRLLVEGTCIRCNRKLTHPDSIASGIGPECSQRNRR